MKEAPVPIPLHSNHAERPRKSGRKGSRWCGSSWTGSMPRTLSICHWKSNEHLAPALDGLTDLDVLVDRRQHIELQALLAYSGFKRFTATPLRGYPAVEDYLGFDEATGRLAHLHLHYQLTLGQRHLKGYRLPWEARVLATRRLDPAHGVFVSDPALDCCCFSSAAR